MMGIIIMTGIALIASIILVNIEAYVNQKDALEEDFLKLLPGLNCGACGFGSCSGMAKAMMENPENYKRCRPLRGDALREMEAFLKQKNLVKWNTLPFLL